MVAKKNLYKNFLANLKLVNFIKKYEEIDFFAS